MRLILSFIFLTGCAGFQVRNGIYTSEEFQPHVNEYLRLKEIFLNQTEANYAIYIYFDDEVIGRTLGLCRNETHKNELTQETWTKKKIRINQDEWRLMNYYQRETLIFHELGHCDLDLDHVEGVDQIMSKHLLHPDYYEKNRDELIFNLFEAVSL